MNVSGRLRGWPRVRMTLARKVAIILALTFAGFIGVTYITIRLFLMPHFLRVEEHETVTAVQRVQNALNDDLADFATIAIDYGAWDRTYEYASSPVSDYAAHELNPDTMHRLGINSVFLLDPKGKPMAFRNFDSSPLTEKQIVPPVMAEAASWLQHLQHTSTPGSGLVVIPHGAVLIAACPILKTNRTGNPRGVLVMLKHLDLEVARMLSLGTYTGVRFSLISDPMIQDELRNLGNMPQGRADGVSVRPQSEHIVSGYSVLPDVNGKPAVLMQVDVPRPVYRQVITSLHFLLLALCAEGVVFGLVRGYLMRRCVMSRLTRLNREITNIGERRDLQLRVTVRGQDEISKLAAAVNTMLEAAQTGTAHLQKIAQYSKQVFWVKNEKTQEVTYEGVPAETYWGFQPAELCACTDSWLQTVHPEDRVRVEQMRKEQQQGIKGEGEFRIVRSDGSICWVWCRHFPVFGSDGKLAETVGMSEDITGQKRAEEVLLQSQDQLWDMMVAVTKAFS